MVSALLESGLYSVTLWVTLIVWVAALTEFVRRRPLLASFVPQILTWRISLAVILVGTLLNLAGGIYKGYISPRDLMQDIVSAQQYLAGRSLYPNHMNQLMRKAIEEDPPHSLLAWSSSLREKEIDSVELTLSQHWVQAHPPLMTLCVTPLVATLGVGGTYLAMVALSLLCFVATLCLIQKGLKVHLQPRHALLLLLVLLGWSDLISALRLGQPGLVLGFLLVAGWYLLRSKRPELAGVAVGAAAALKAFPLLLLFYLLLRHRRAFLTAIATLAILILFGGVMAGWDSYLEHLETARGVVAEYADYPANMSLLALVARLDGPQGQPHPLAQALFYAMGFVILAVMAFYFWRNPRRSDEKPVFLDLEYSLMMTVMVMLSPVSWDHYLVIVLLPLVVLGQQVLGVTHLRPGPVALFAGIVTLLTLPDPTFGLLSRLATDATGPMVARLIFMPLRTYLLAILCYWLVRQAVRTPQELPHLHVTEPDSPVSTALASTAQPQRVSWAIISVLLLTLAAHLVVNQSKEPYFNNDETRHVMTGVFFHDLLLDFPLTSPRAYTERYYLQYPALGLLVWPPFFYLVEGVAMLFLGTSFTVARLVMGLFAGLAIIYLFRLAYRTHGRTVALVASLLLALSPLVFQHSHQVMLEVPTMALSLVALFHVVRYLEEQRTSDLAICALATALTALTRYDGIFLAPLFLILLLGRRQLGVLLRPRVLLAGLGAVLLVAPAYGLAAREMGGAHLHAMSEGTESISSSFLAWENFSYYPLCIPEQVGWFIALPAVVGLGLAMGSAKRAVSWPYLALVGATYLTFTPMAELAPRHAIYWVPALVVFAADAMVHGGLVAGRWGLSPLLNSAVVLGTAVLTLATPVHSLSGYEAAAKYVLKESTDSPFCLFDGLLNGNFIYQVRRNDPERRLWVLRGDKVLYGVMSDPNAAYAEWATNEAEILAVIDRYGPEFLIVEEPQIYFHIPAAERLRETLRKRSDRFVKEAVFPLKTTRSLFEGGELHVYRNLGPKGTGQQRVEVRMLGMGRSLQTQGPNAQ